MRDILGESLKRLKRIRVHKSRMTALVLALSLVVSLDVFWVLRQPGLTLAGDAACGILEHAHDDTCLQQICICELPEEEEEHIHEDACYEEELLCTLEEHTHSIDCYSDETADVETQLDWQEMFADYPYTGDLREDLVGIARTQAGYAESTLNFEVDRDGERHGYTRYGAWYGAPYGDWSATFISFCLHYAGADPEEYPGNTGAASMARLWDKLGKYAPAGEYEPIPGDLVFFEDNTAGIVTEVYNATFYVLRGDVDDAVSGETLSLYDESISGWGITEGEFFRETLEEEPEEALEEEPEEVFSEGLDEEFPGEIPLLFSSGAVKTSANLITYLEDNGGSYSFTLTDPNDVELPKDDNGNYIATAETSYELSLIMNSPNGFHPGTYTYQLPDGLLLVEGNGTFILDSGVNVGHWTLSSDGLLTVILNDNANTHTEVTISAEMGVQFAAEKESIKFDGNITITVGKPPQANSPTEVIKWGSQGGEGKNPSKIYWEVLITGHAGSQVPGSILSDQAILSDWSHEHRYTASDIDAGLYIGVSDATGGWHEWTVYPDDPNLIWTETGWFYKIPEQAHCNYCGELPLGNDGWTYHIKYTSTPVPTGVAGEFGYANYVSIDGKEYWGWFNFVHGEVQGEIVKQGSFQGDADGGSFLWEVQTTVPGMIEGQKAKYSYYIVDSLRIRDNGGGTIGVAKNDISLAKVTATNNGTTIQVPRIQNATENDQFAWDNSWEAVEGGVANSQAIELLHRCNCTEEICSDWNNGKCALSYGFKREDGNWYTNGFCHCWTVTGETTFTLTYETEDLSVIENFGGQGNVLRNEVELYNHGYQPNGDWGGVKVTDASAAVTIPSLFRKEMTQAFNGSTAHYRITVNESKIVLTNGDPLTIHDVMTQTLAFISGSLVITTEDANGNIGTLQQGKDFTVTYDGTGNVTDESGTPVHVLDIEILHPQPVMYILDYDTTLVIPPGTTQGVKYSNYATISLWGQEMSNTTVEKTYTSINISAKSYQVEMHKKDAQTGAPLPGATFGLFNAQGGLITSDVTDERGTILFQTNIIQGIILREHVLYYLQELEAPPGYRLDDTKYWFCFCNSTMDSCATCDAVMVGTDAFRIPYDEIGKVDAVNELMHYDLPATGGPGVYPLILVSVMLVLTPLVYIPIRRRKQERRGVG